MTMKIAVSLPDEQVAEAKRAVAQGRARSVSAYVAAALAQQGKRKSLRALLDDMDAEYGPPSHEAIAYVDGVLDAAWHH